MEKIVEKEDVETVGDADECDSLKYGKMGVKKHHESSIHQNNSNHVHFNDSVVSKSSSSLKSNRIRRYSEQFHKTSDFSLK